MFSQLTEFSFSPGDDEVTKGKQNPVKSQLYKEV